MMTMALHATGRGFVARLERNAVDTRGVSRPLRLVTCPAIHRLQHNCVVGVLGRDILMAGKARFRPVSRGFHQRPVHEQGKSLSALVGLGKRLVRVALQATGIIEPGRRLVRRHRVCEWTQ